MDDLFDDLIGGSDDDDAEGGEGDDAEGGEGAGAEQAQDQTSGRSTFLLCLQFCPDCAPLRAGPTSEEVDTGKDEQVADDLGKSEEKSGTGGSKEPDAVAASPGKKAGGGGTKAREGDEDEEKLDPTNVTLLIEKMDWVGCVHTMAL